MKQKHHGEGDNIGRDKVVVKGDFIQYGKHEVPHYLTKLPTLSEEVVGREKEFSILHRTLEAAKRIVLINGIGGIGKTTMAIEYANRYKEEYLHIAWIEQLGDFATDLATNKVLCTNLKITSSDDTNADARLILNTLSNLSGKSLLILDNVNQQLKQFIDYFPKAPEWHVLITSRQELSVAQKIALDFLSEENALKLFYNHYSQSKDDDIIMKILYAIDYHTLTIELLAKTAERIKRTLTLEKLWQNIQERGLRLGKEINISTTHSQQQNIEKIFPYLLSIFELQNLSEKEQWLLKQFVCLPPTVHTFDELKDLLQLETDEDIEALESVLLQLQEKGWLINDKASDTYKMHRIIQEVVLAQLEIREDDVSTLINTLIILTTCSREKNLIDLFQWIPYSKRLSIAMGTEQSVKIGSLYNNIGMLYKAQGRYEEALTFYQRAIQIREIVLASEHPDLATSYNNISLLYNAQGRDEEAFIFLQKAIQIQKVVLAPQHPELANSYNNIAGLYFTQGQYEDALTFYQEAIHIREVILPPQHPDLATSYNNIALLYQTQGHYEEALTYLQKAVQIQQALLDPQHPYLANYYNNIGMLYKAQGRYVEALKFYQNAIQIQKAIFDHQHPELAISYNHFGMLYKAQGRYEEALTYLQKAIQIRESILDPQHPDLATSYNNIGLLYKAQGQYEEALVFYQKAIQIRESLLNLQHPELASYYNNIGMLYKTQGRYKKAFMFLQKAIQIQEAVLDPQHSDLAISYNNIGLLCKTQERYEEAFIFLQKAVKTLRNSLGDQHPKTQAVIKNLESLKME